MSYSAEIKVMPLKDLLDPQGKAVTGGLHSLGLNNVEDVRIGKHIVVKINAASKEEAYSIAEDAAKKLLANQVMEDFHIEITQ
ncbi:MAG: phosphoribosylformylglycinamidine synthase subunit PurS [Ginsengibacter sp.]